MRVQVQGLTDFMLEILRLRNLLDTISLEFPKQVVTEVQAY